MCLFTDHSSSGTCIMVLPWLTFVLLCAPFFSPLPMICTIRVMASVRDLGKGSSGRGFSRYSLLGMLLKMFDQLKAKRSVVVHHVTHPHLYHQTDAYNIRGKPEVFHCASSAPVERMRERLSDGWKSVRSVFFKAIK